MPSTGIESSGLSLWLRERRFSSRMRAANAEFSVFVVSSPKSGRTWHRVLIGYYLSRLTNRDPRDSFDLRTLCEISNTPLIQYTHNGSCFSDKLPPTSAVVASSTEWRGRKVIFLTRDIRDLLVSAYFHVRYREKKFNGSISEFVRHPFVGAPKVLTARNRWYEAREQASRFEVFSYEKMLADTESALRKTLSILDIMPDEEVLREAIGFGAFENLQKLEQQDFFHAAEMRNETGDPRASKIRRGKRGGFREHLSEADLTYISDLEAQMGNPFAKYEQLDS